MDSLEPVGGSRGGTLTQPSGSAGSGASGGNAVGGSRAAPPSRPSFVRQRSWRAATGMGTAGGGSELAPVTGRRRRWRRQPRVRRRFDRPRHGRYPNNTLLIYASAADYKLVERTIRELDRRPCRSPSRRPSPRSS
jgi:type II secretory pathway component GspD/PulD (secretin)